MGELDAVDRCIDVFATANLDSDMMDVVDSLWLWWGLILFYAIKLNNLSKFNNLICLQFKIYKFLFLK